MVGLPMQTNRPCVSDRRRHRPGTAFLGFLALMVPGWFAVAEERSGEQIYRQQCASCHGTSGEGTAEEYPHPLTGDRSVAQLARLIARTMPADDPGICTGTDAERVAAFVHDTFYSKAAQARNAPPRIELSRLTVRQYRNAIADLIATFQGADRWDDRRGLRGEYFKSRQFRNNDRVIDRTDARVEFDFGEASPEPETMDAPAFSIRWEGSVLAPETGDYEFNVQTQHSTRFWINDLKRPLIDGTVHSGTDTDHRASVFLLGGRTYPVRLEFSKSKQGVQDKKNKDNPPPPVKASIALEWKLPHRPFEVIPEHNLSPKSVPPTFVATTPFPPDDRSAGYERGSSVSKAWDQATTDAAIEVADYVDGHLADLSGVKKSNDDREKRLAEFCRRFAERAFRRPLTDEQVALYIDRPFQGTPDPELAVKRVVLFVLKSPRFLYREISSGRPDAYDVASRISFGLWDSLPDQALEEAAAAGRLADREQVATQAGRMVDDPRTRAKLRDFFLQWLRVEQVPDIAKDPERFSGFDEATASDLRTSLDLFLEDVVWGEGSDFRRLLLADELFLNGRLANFYGADLPADSPFRKVVLESGERAGLLSHPYLMATFAYSATTSPIHRGVFLARSVLGRALRPPPEAAAPLAPDLHPDLTTRERVALQTRPAACTTCHAMINPLGFPLENFDAVGRFRSEEKGKTIDATGAYQARSGETVTFNGVRELAAFLAGSEETHDAFVEQLFHHLIKQPIRAYGPRCLADLRGSFVGDGYNIRKLAVEIVAASALAPRVEGP
jgi:hypothetical protein